MLGRLGAVIRWVPWLACAVLVGIPSAVDAHRLDAQAFLLPDQSQIRVEAWFDNGTPARGANIQVFSGERLVTQGETDSEARFVFAVTEIQPLRVVIKASGGHRKELDVSADDLRRSMQDKPSSLGERNASPIDSPAAVPLTGAPTGSRLKDLLLGVSFVLALAAFLLSLRTARQIRAGKNLKRGAF